MPEDAKIKAFMQSYSDTVSRIQLSSRPTTVPWEIASLQLFLVQQWNAWLREIDGITFEDPNLEAARAALIARTQDLVGLKAKIVGRLARL